MSGENEQDLETEAQERDVDFDAGFTGATATPAPAPEKNDASASAAVQTASPSPAPAPEFVQVTKQDFERLNTAAAKIDEISGTVNKKFDTAFGQMGALKQMIGKLQTETPAGDTVIVSEEDFADLKNQYPDLADLTRQGLNKALARLKGTGGAGADPKAFDEKAKEIRTSVRNEVVDMTLDTIMDGDWQEMVNQPPYRPWISGQQANIQKLAESDNLRDAARLMRLYKAHLDAPSAPPPIPTPAPTASPAASTRQHRVAAAVPPRGDGGHPPARAEEDEFSAGFNYRKTG